MSTWKNFLIRTASAIVALLVIFFLYSNWQISGLKGAIAFVALVGSWEAARLFFAEESFKLYKYLFIAVSMLTFFASGASLSFGTLAFCLSLILLISISLFFYKTEDQLSTLMRLHSKSALGLFYVGVLPSFVYKILTMDQGVSWFIFLLSSVFAGDTLAYLVGITFGKNKIMPAVSPKKSWEGAAGGLLGSTLAGAVCWSVLFKDQSVYAILLIAAFAGVSGQFGDFFESLLKRMANVKDSGKIMPGHGGVLDRVDGLLFASPVILAGILILTLVTP